MNYVYIVLYNNSVSSVGYDTVVGAITFIENRNNKPIQNKDKGLLWTDSKGDEYRIKEIKIV
ncbi:PAS domain S-box [Clostridium botulinum B str. Osaka05]|uniref:PAS domain S-box n=1 Tax=Clostridium botulinum B str. Osaka05 TaxID=1407017 RepID=A0A060N533_CLOBO|nr:hypothetical protein [Clostridium botulinum]BAO04987.1 PAS domain S-box [Clostridium botulinum B str. Osaka05]